MNDKYDKRYSAFQAAINEHSDRRWEEATSFIAFPSESSIGEIAKSCYAALTADDLFLIRSMDAPRAWIYGNITDRDIFAFMPYLKEIKK